MGRIECFENSIRASFFPAPQQSEASRGAGKLLLEQRARTLDQLGLVPAGSSLVRADLFWQKMQEVAVTSILYSASRDSTLPPSGLSPEKNVQLETVFGPRGGLS